MIEPIHCNHSPSQQDVLTVVWIFYGISLSRNGGSPVLLFCTLEQTTILGSHSVCFLDLFGCKDCRNSYYYYEFLFVKKGDKKKFVSIQVKSQPFGPRLTVDWEGGVQQQLPTSRSFIMTTLDKTNLRRHNYVVKTDWREREEPKVGGMDDKILKASWD